jgi:hypothetical protein
MPLVSDSSNIASIDFDAETHELRVGFIRDGSIYLYPMATEAMYQQFLVAPSKGRYLRSVIIPALGKGRKIQ